MRDRTQSTASRATDRAIPIPGALFAAASSFSVAKPALAADELVLIPDPLVLLVMIVAFVVLIYPLNALLFKPVFMALDARAERIEGARVRSARLDAEADAALDRYQTAVREARAESEGRRQQQLERARSEQLQITAAAREEAEGEIERARQELDRSLDDARATLRRSVEELAGSAASQVLGRSLS